MPVLVITGPRQAGKTTLARKGIDSGTRRFYSLDELQILSLAQKEPARLLSSLPVTIDEVQRAPQFLLEVKRTVDEGRRLEAGAMRGKIVLTGSANLAIMEKVGESLAGRASYMGLYPFCPAEWLGKGTVRSALESLFGESFSADQWPARGDTTWESWAVRGGFPDVLTMPDAEARELWYAGYLQTYLERDLRQLANIGSLSDFQRLMRLASLRSARLLNLSELARDAAIPQPSAHRYMSYLETGYQIARLSNYRTNPTTSLVKTRKLMWTDVGFASWLAGVTEANLRTRPDCSFWLEQLVYQTLQTWASVAPTRRIHYWRDGLNEVDFVLESAGELVGVEVKASTTLQAQDLKALKAFQASFEKKGQAVPRGILLYNGQAPLDLGPRLHVLPIASLW